MSRRRLYLMRHADVAYFDERGRPLSPDGVELTDEGREQALAAAEAFRGVRFDRLVTSGLPRALETARLVALRPEPEPWPELRELEPGPLREIPPDELEEAFVGSFRGVIPEQRRFLGGETIGSLLDRVLPALGRLVADPTWDVVLAVLHGGVNRAILSYALTGERSFFGNFEQAPGCINVIDVGEDWIVRAVNVAPSDLVHLAGRSTTMERLFALYRP
jgi:broad specificity phosphatase PhoE